MGTKVAIEVSKLSKSFRLPTERSSELKQSILNFVRGIKGYKEQQVLNRISFTVNNGDFFGIVGRNGSGKSTLLKLLSGIYQPNKGNIKVNGSLVPFIELGVGFNHELTGRENVYLNGALLGFSDKQVDDIYDEIVNFAELHDFMDQKLKNYSSGMQVRLAFSIAIQAKSDILILDEVLAVGDEAFQRKCLDYFSNLKKDGRTIVLVTHDMSVVERYCNKAILIEEGQIIASDTPVKVARQYSDLLFSEVEEVREKDADGDRFGSGEIIITKPKITFSQDYKTALISFGLEAKRPLNEKADVAYTVKDATGIALFGNSHELTKLSGKQTYSAAVEISFANNLAAGSCFVDLSVRFPERNVYTDCWIDAIKFESRLKTNYATPIIVDDSFKEKSSVAES